MIDVTIDLEVLSDLPVSVGAGGSAGTLADKVIVRDGRGRPLIPGSQVKGRARHAAEAIAATLGLGVPQYFGDETDTVIRRIFGSPQHRAPLHFANVIADVGDQTKIEPQWLSQLRPSVAINRRRGTADDERLLLQETALRGMRFIARPAIVGTLPDLGHAALLWAALRAVDRWGGAKSRGLGWATTNVRVIVNGQEQNAAVLTEALRDLVRRGGA
ncbi:MAG: RAMP superfamily CRISPR-associated protein [Roseiflexaceae bacterium]|nr:RAMP superfamily CRISPR-associated protein [Roseiflexaceae bacterium]